MSETLKPCPFCNKSRASVIGPHGDQGYFVECQHCEARGPRFSSDEEAASEWNNRADDNRWRSVAEQNYEALSELRDLMEHVRIGAYKPDSFTLQPADKALSAFDSLRKEGK